MDPEHAHFLTAQRLARRLTGHLQSCGCEQCTLYGKLLESDEGLRELFHILHHRCVQEIRDQAFEALVNCKVR